MTDSNKTLYTRRSTLKGLAALATIQIVLSHIALGGPKAPSNQLTKGGIGCGAISRTHLRMPGKLLALCDVDSNHLKTRMDEAKGLGLKDVDLYSDFLEMIARKDDESPVHIEVDTQKQDIDAVFPWRWIEMTYASVVHCISIPRNYSSSTTRKRTNSSINRCATLGNSSEVEFCVMIQ